MQLTGDNWDAAIFEGLRSDPPPILGTWQSKHQHVVRVILGVIGDSLREFFRYNLARIIAVAGAAPDDPVHLFVHWMGIYYLRMYSMMCGSDIAAMPGWRQAVRNLASTGVAGTTQILVTFQLGFPLLCPLLLNEVCARPMMLLVHSENEFARNFLSERLPKAEIRFVEMTGALELLRSLREGKILIANIDTAYPGTRILETKFLDYKLQIPAGLFLLGERAGVGMQCLAAPYGAGGLEGHLGPALELYANRGAKNLQCVREFFEPLVRSHPYQWMAWASLTP